MVEWGWQRVPGMVGHSKVVQGMAERGRAGRGRRPMHMGFHDSRTVHPVIASFRVCVQHDYPPISSYRRKKTWKTKKE